jgi:multiple antibiotic resistance protein
MLATFDSSFHHILATLLLTVGALLPIVDPLSAAPLYLQMTSGLDSNERATMAKAVARDSFLLLLSCALVGAYVLDFFGLSIPAVQVAGGIVLCAIGWKLLNGPDVPDAPTRATAAEAEAGNLQRRAFYPLTMPLTIGPGSISVAITLGANPHRVVRPLLVTALGHALGILVVAASVYLCYRYAHALVRWLGDTGRTVVIRLSSFILLCIGVQIAWNGIRALVVAAFPGTAAG